MLKVDKKKQSILLRPAKPEFDEGLQFAYYLDQAAKRNAFRLKLMQILFAPVWRILETIPEGDFYLQGMAIQPEFRGAGIGSLLIDDIENRAKESGAKRISLDVSAKNNGARRLYKRFGMVVSSAWPNSRVLPTVFLRMAKYL